MSLRVCSEPGCAALVPAPQGRCEPHEKAARTLREAGRPSRQARGYGAVHEALRRRWAVRIARGDVPCARCGKPITPGSPWDLGHDDTNRTVYTGPEHEACNRARGRDGTRGHRRRSV